MSPDRRQPIGSTSTPITEENFQAIRDAFTGLRYGQVTVTVQDGKIMQIDRTERHRLASDRTST